MTEQVLRFAHYVLLLGLFGWSAFWLIGLRNLTWLSERRPHRGFIVAAIAAPIVSSALMLASIAAMMGTPVTALDWPMTEAMVLGTTMGTAFMARSVLLLSGLGALVVGRRSRAGFVLAAACYAGALLTLGWSGHAAATEGNLGLFHRLNNGVHLLAAGMWLGAISWFLYLTAAAHRRPDDGQDRDLLGAMHRFAPTGVALVGVVAISGIINSQMIFGLENSGDVLTTGYGILLAIKVALVGMMVVFGAHNARIGRRHHAKAADMKSLGSNLAMSRLRRSLAFELGFASITIGTVAVLGMMSPMLMP